MNEEEKARVRAWKRGMEEVNRITREENRRRTPEERLHRVMMLMASRGMYGREHSTTDRLTAAQARWVAAVDALRVRAHA